MAKAVGQHRDEVAVGLRYAHVPVTLRDLLDVERSALLMDCKKKLADPKGNEGDWSSFLNDHPDALTAVYEEPISHVHREVYIAPKDRVDYLGNMDMGSNLYS